jgi:hypothetical protein
MISFYFSFFISLLLWGIVYSINKPDRFFQFPALMTLAFGSFVLPQAISLIQFPGLVSEKAIEQILLMICLCLGSSFFFYKGKPSRLIIKLMLQPLNYRRLFHIGLFFIAVAYFFQASLGSIEVKFAATGGMTGAGTILLFFQQLIYPGFAICLFSAIRKPSFLNIFASIIGSIPLIQTIVIGRREGTAMVCLILACAFFYERKFTPPKWVFLFSIIFAMLIIPSTGNYRSLYSVYGSNAIKEIDFVENLKQFAFEESPILELRNAAAIIEATDLVGEFKWGSDYWNHLVFRFVPAQLVGKEFKDNLSIGGKASDFTEQSSLQTGYQLSVGSTLTGMADSYQQFGYFGCLFFGLMAVIFKSIWEVSLIKGAIYAQLLYVLSATSAMRAVTHWTQDFFPGILTFIIFLGIAVWYSKEKK